MIAKLPARRTRLLITCFAASLISVAAIPAWAHVKWFSQTVALQDAPLTLEQILTSTFFALAALSVVVIVGLTLFDDPIQNLGPYRRLREAFAARQAQGFYVMRIATGMSLLLSWQANVVLAPELAHELALVSWMQFVAILCLLDTRTTPIAGGLVWALYVVCLVQFGVFHMLDYIAFVGVGFYLLFHESPRDRLRGLVKPVLFASTGLSLAWLALEKLVFPTWGLVLLEQNPTLTLGLPPSFFLTAAAFVEFSLGYLLLLGVLGRPLALVITVVFFCTSMVFGKDEVVGHIILHGVLIAFMLEGTRGPLAPPFRLHASKLMKIAFVSVNFVLLLGIMLVSYQGLAAPRNMAPVAHPGEHGADASVRDVGGAPGTGPTVALTASLNDDGSWNLALTTGNFAISPTASRPAPDGLPTEGHAHLFVDGKMRTMIFSTPHTLEALAPGSHEIVVQLSGADHQTLTRDGKPIEARATVVQP